MTPLAQQVIDKERQERTGYLDLGRCGLTELPDISDMDWLETLVLSNAWWDESKQKWIRSKNGGTPNIFFNIRNKKCCPENLTKLIAGGEPRAHQFIKDWSFVENLRHLKTIDLSYNHITNGSFLGNLPQLISLDLRVNQIKDGKFLENLSHLILLDLSKNQIGDGRFLENLPHLKMLYLRHNQISDLGFLKKLTNLISLNLLDNRIQYIGFLKNLCQLIDLDIGYNQISEGHFLEDLPQLVSLKLSNNRINNGRFLEKLTQIVALNLSYNQINTGQPLEKLTQLKYLNLSNNQIRDGQFLEKLTNLTSLDLSGNQITNWKFLKSLPQLTSLGLWGAQINDGRILENLDHLTTLDLGNNQISDGKFLERFTQLTSLCLSKNQISDWKFLENLVQLTSLDISNNQINDARFLENLVQLTSLDISNNQINDVCFIENLRHLDKIVLSNNKLKDISNLQYFFKIKGLDVMWRDWYEVKNWEIGVKDNPIEEPPVDIVKQGNAAILEYYRQKEKTGAAPLLEAKLILLGDGRAGKTSLANRLLGKPLPQEKDRTQGVDIVIGEYEFPVVEGQFKLHIWDFAGQDKYKPLHQFFYTEGAVYVMVADSGNTNTDYDDWLQTAQLFGEGSPVMVALNEFREGIGYGTFDPEHWQKRFAGLLKEVFLVNLLTENNFGALKNAIHQYAQLLPHAKVAYPKNWAAIRQELERRRNENFISLKEYYQICAANDLPEKDSALILSGVLHRIGVCLHYQKSPLLKQLVILKNEWATDAVYKILEDKAVAEDKKGFFNWDDLHRIWSDEQYCDMQPQLLELMQQFKMAYPLPNTQEFVTPPLLPTTPPPGWDMPKEPTLEMYLEYEFLPKALTTQFIVSRHTDIDRGRTLVWRNGVVLRWPGAMAEVVKTKSQGRDAYCIRAQGKDGKGLLTSILKTFRDLHEDYKGIKVAEIVPCPCEGCVSGKNKQHFFEFENLKNRLEKGRRTVECDKSLDELQLVELLGGLFVFEKLAVGQPVVIQSNSGAAQQEELNQSPLAYLSYAPADEAYLKMFKKHLRPLERKGAIRLWDQDHVLAGGAKTAEMQQALHGAGIIFLLLTSNYLADDRLFEKEIPEAVKRHEAGLLKVVPIRVSPCHEEDFPFNSLQCLPRNGAFISKSGDEESAWLEIAKEIGALLEKPNP